MDIKYSFISAVGDLFPEFLKINKNIPMSFKFEKIHVSKNNIHVNVIVQTIKNDQYAPEYPNKLLQQEEIEESSF